MIKVAVAAIHGMGHSDQHFADGLIEGVKDFLGSEFSDQVEWVPLHWADLLEGRQARYLRRANRAARLDWQQERDFIVHTLGDAVAYRKEPGYANQTYDRVHAKINMKLHQGWSEFGHRSIPLIWVANSLGGYVMSNFIWDTMRDRRSDSKFMLQETIRYIFTTGCSIPLFNFGHRNIIPIQLPDGAEWYNIYDRDDVLAWPLKPINQAYDEVVTEDVEVKAGGLLTGWNPLCHLDYWTDFDVVSRIGDAIRQTIEDEDVGPNEYGLGCE